jgi:flagellar protein FlgJ
MTAAITDFTQYTGLRVAAEKNDPAALREVASQFEALFLQSMLKNMREASLGDPIFGNSDQHEMYQGMMDQQLAVEMASGKGIGLADMLVRQLGGQEASKLTSTSNEAKPAWSDPKSFARDIWPHAERAAKELDVAPEAIVAHAALETGWGAHVMPDRSGASSNNLFGIKAGSSWSGEEVTKKTLEYDANIPRHEYARFRSYNTIDATFDDYAEFLNKPRYEDVRGHGNDVAGFARALQASGYATDPDYANKLTGVLDSPTMQGIVAELKNSSPEPITRRLPANGP